MPNEFYLSLDGRHRYDSQEMAYFIINAVQELKQGKTLTFRRRPPTKRHPSP